MLIVGRDFFNEAVEMGGPKTIFFWGCENCFNAEANPLLHHQEWEVIRIPETANLETVAHKIEKEHPNIVFIERKEDCTDIDIAWQLACKNPGIKIIMIDWKNDWIETYCKQSVYVYNIGDLLSVVES